MTNGDVTCPALPMGPPDVAGGSQSWTVPSTCTVTTDDPRVSGTETSAAWKLTAWGKVAWGTLVDGAGIQSGPLRIENAGGAWIGNGSGTYSSDRGDIVVSWYKGTGGYAGLGYFELRTGKGTYSIRGLIFPGDPPNLAGLPPVTGLAPSPNVPAAPTPVPTSTPKALAYGPVSVVQGTSEYTYVDLAGGTYAGNDTVNDPRVSGTFLGPSWTMKRWGATSDSLGAGTQWGPSRLETAGGTWEGVGSGIYDEGGDVIAIWYKGSGSYAGLSYFELLARSDLFGATMTGTGVFGEVFPGDPPTP